MINQHACYQHHRIVQFAETDRSGAVHFTNVLRYVEEAEHSFLQSKHMPICETGHFIPRVHISCDYRKPLHCFDHITITLEAQVLGQTSTTWKFVITRNDAVCAEGKMITVTVRTMPE